jgi:hypothetical protein
MSTEAKKAKELIDWLSDLSDLDVTNFKALLALGPSAVRRLPKSNYKNMAVIGLALVESGKNDKKVQASRKSVKPKVTRRKKT